MSERFRRAVRRAGVVAALLSGSLAAQVPVPPKLGSIRGVASDSLRGGGLAGAFVELVPTGRQLVTDPTGLFRFDGVAGARAYRIRVMHSMLDTLGIALITPEFTLLAGEEMSLDVGVPPASRLVDLLCGPERLAREPNALVGFVRDPEDGRALETVRVSLVYDAMPALPGRFPVTRTAVPDTTGHFAICGLPAGARALVRLIRDGVESSDIPLETSTDSPLTLRAFGVSRSTRRLTTGTDSLGRPVSVLRGGASAGGTVVSMNGDPIAGASVQMQGTAARAVTLADGSFRLDSVPTGTQVLSVRKIGYAATVVAVDVARYELAAVKVAMPELATPLGPVVTVAPSRRQKDLEDVGFARRKQAGLGYFRDGDEIDRGPPSLGEAFRMIPGIRVGYDAQNQTAQKTLIMTSRDPKGCLRFVVDGVVWPDGGNRIEDFVRPDELEALEMYSWSTVPGEFAAAGRGRCSVLVLWTLRKVNRPR